MPTHEVANRDEWLAARRDLLEREKQRPRGRDEEGLSFPMAWVRRHDEYAGVRAAV